MGTSDEVAERLWAASRLGLAEKLRVALNQGGNDILKLRDNQGRTALHHAAASGYEECIEQLLCRGSSCLARDNNGDTPLHLAAKAGLPMASYQICSRDASTCLQPNATGQTPVDMAAGSSRGEVLNALLLACSGCAGDKFALPATRALLDRGAVCDTWAPSGSSALMLASSADGEEAVRLLLAHGATLELQDALGRTALMFAAGNGAVGATRALLEGGACLSARDRRGRGVLEYAGAPGTPVRTLLAERLAELESKSAALQAALLEEESRSAGRQQKKGKKKKKKKGGSGEKETATEQQVSGLAKQQDASSESSASSTHHLEVAQDDDGGDGAETPLASSSSTRPMAEQALRRRCSDEDKSISNDMLPRQDKSSIVPKDADASRSQGAASGAAPPAPESVDRAPSPDWHIVGPHKGKEGRHSRQQQGRAQGTTTATILSSSSSRPTSQLRGRPTSRASSSGTVIHSHQPNEPLLAPTGRASSLSSRHTTSRSSSLDGGATAIGDGKIIIAPRPAEANVTSQNRPSVAPWASTTEQAKRGHAMELLNNGGEKMVKNPETTRSGVAASSRCVQDSCAQVSHNEGVLWHRLHALELELEETRRTHAMELSRLREEAAAAQAAAVRKAVMAERTDCILRFAGFLQSHGLTSLPDVLAAGGHGLGRVYAGGGTVATGRGYVPEMDPHQHHPQNNAAHADALPPLDIARLVDDTGHGPISPGDTPSPPYGGTTEVFGMFAPLAGPTPRFGDYLSPSIARNPGSYAFADPNVQRNTTSSEPPGTGSSAVFTLNLGTTC